MRIPGLKGIKNLNQSLPGAPGTVAVTPLSAFAAAHHSPGKRKMDGTEANEENEVATSCVYFRSHPAGI
jgi:hypothetical protein